MGMTDFEQELHERLVTMRNQLADLSEVNVTLIGDIILDRYIHGFANNLNSRAPVPVLNETSRHQDVGAAAHVAKGVNALGMKAKLFAVVGDDEHGGIIIDSLEAQGVASDGVAMIEELRTTVKTRFLASRESLVSNQQVLLSWDQYSEHVLPRSASENLLDQVKNDLQNSDVLIISDYGLGVVDDNSAITMITEAKKNNVPVIYTPKLTGLHRTTGVDWVIFGRRGLDLLRRRMGENTSREAALRLINENEWENLVVLGGEDGVTIHTLEHEVRAPCTLDNPSQQIGLMDSAAVAITAAISLEMDNESTAHLTNAASEVILETASVEEHIITKQSMIERLDEISWELQISQR